MKSLHEKFVRTIEKISYILRKIDSHYEKSNFYKFLKLFHLKIQIFIKFDGYSNRKKSNFNIISAAF